MGNPNLPVKYHDFFVISVLSKLVSMLKKSLFLIFCLAFSMLTQQTLAQYAVGARIAVSASHAELGTSMLARDFLGNGSKQLLLGAPGEQVSGISQAGSVYLYDGRFSGDTTLTASSRIIFGNTTQGRIGEIIVAADFNGNGTLDLAVSKRRFTSDGRGAVGIFYGPFTPGQARSFSAANVLIVSEHIDDNFGVSIYPVPGLHGASSKHGLVIGARDNSEMESFAGAAYLFKDLTTASQFTSGQADAIFYGQVNNGTFGTSVIAGDFNGNGHGDIIIGAPRTNDNGRLSGTAYMYFGPFTESQYMDNDADVRIIGRDQTTVWAYRMASFSDISGNGIADFSISSDLDNTGRLALFYGREEWPSVITIGAIPDETHQHRFFNRSSSNSQTGFSADFSGDYNISGRINPVLGAPRTNGNVGAVTVYSFTGSAQRNITINNRQDSRFGTAIVNVGPVLEKNIPFTVDDFAVSAPGANIGFANATNSGLVLVYGGVVTQPSTNITVQPGLNRVIGDTITVRTTYSEGSRPIVSERLIIARIQQGEVVRRDTIFVDPLSGGARNYEFSFHDNYRVNFRYEVVDELGFQSVSSTNVEYAMIPLPFNLVTDFGEEMLEIQGNPNQIIRFLQEASADTNGRNISYQLAFSLNPNGFTPGSFNYRVVGSSPTLGREVTYTYLNEYVRQEYNLNEAGTLYWTYIASNGVHTRFAANGPREIRFIRRGLDPFFQITSGDRRIIIEGFPDDNVTFAWTAMTTEDPNAFIQYNFKLLDQKDNVANPIFSRFSSDSGTEPSIRLTYDDLEKVLIENNLLDIAKSDTAYLYYSVEAIINNIPGNNWYPDILSRKAYIKYVQIIREDENGSSTDLPDEIPTDFVLQQNYPNPFNPVTTIVFGLPEDTSVSLQIFNLLGQQVYQWNSSGPLAAGFHQHTINASRWASGHYFYRAIAGSEVRTGKMLLVK